MPVTVRVGAIHLGWDVVSVAAGGGGTPIRPVQVEGSYTTPAYLLADASGRLHTAGLDRQRPDLGMAIADVRDILGHPQIVIAGATWPAELVFRARLYNPLAAVGKYLRGKPDVVALPYPDGWPDEKVDTYCELVEQLDVTVEPLPESVALSGYVRALGLVRPPDRANPRGVGATGVYSDGRTMLVVAVHADDEQPTESVDVAIAPEATRDARSADDAVIEVMAAARAIGADTSTVLLAGNVCFNDPLRLAFQNHLGHRLHSADHPMHALVLGAAHLVLSESEGDEPEPGGRPVPSTAPPSRPVPPQPGPQAARPQQQPARQQPPGPQRPPMQQGPMPPNAQVRDRPAMTGEHGRHSAETAASRFTRPPEAGKVWDKMKGNLYGAQAAAGAVALAAFAMSGQAGVAELEAVDTRSIQVACSLTPEAVLEPPSGIAAVRAPAQVECGQPGVNTLRYLVPGPPGAVDFGPPLEI